MAGFSDQTTGLAGVRVVPHPAVMLFIDIGGGLVVDAASGWQQRGSVVAGLAPVSVAGRGGLSPLASSGGSSVGSATYRPRQMTIV